MTPALRGDAPAHWPVLASRPVHADPYLSVRVDSIRDREGGAHDRTVVTTFDAVAVVAMDGDRVLLIEQYRHAVGMRMCEIPAGLLDVAGESPQVAAARELAEEADIHADTWQPILEMSSNPGFATGRWSVFLATGISEVPLSERGKREAEEADMTQQWVPFDEALDAVLDGRITNALTVAALLAVRGRGLA